jgi:hypothetical protein
LRRVIVKYLRDHPEDRFDSADILVGLALTESFPCKEKQDEQKSPIAPTRPGLEPRFGPEFELCRRD